MDRRKRTIPRIFSDDVLAAALGSDSEDNLISDDSDLDEDWSPQNQLKEYVETESSSDEEYSCNTSSALSESLANSIDQPSTSKVTSTPKSITKGQLSKAQAPTTREKRLHYQRSSGNIEPIDIFSHYFTDQLLDDIVYQSNLYAIQQSIDTPLGLTKGELFIFLGINIVMTYIRYSRLRMYWSSNTCLRCNLIANAMSVNRFERIRRFLHFADNTENTESTDRLKKMRPFLDAMNSTFKSAVTPEEFHSVDEMMIPFTGGSSLKQYIRSKPKKWGYKVWVRSGVSGYVYDFEIYQGANGNRPEKELGLCADVLMCLCLGLEGKYHKVFFDNLFTTMELLKTLREKKILSTGTLRKNRLLGAENILAEDKSMKRRGEFSYTTSQCDVTVVKWNDNSFVHTASTFAGVEPLSYVERWDKKEKVKVNVTRPFAIEIYNQHMGGVDLTDFLVSCYRHNLKQKKCWVIYRWLEEGSPLDLLAFRSSVATALIGKGLSLGSKKGRSCPSSSQAVPPAKLSRLQPPAALRKNLSLGHFPENKEQKNASRCRSMACTKRCRYMCGVCQVYLCPECFADYHQ
ncbi:piggyBac transposable element-derived protein 3-like [Watersipora subatra]|uniref:piggyBac transposable element-derived protein 3-like n=1 Tax=Watersipora subatra TaxID=2589382 RepID=UPI00355C9BF2